MRDREARVRVAALAAAGTLRLCDGRTMRETRRCLDDADPSVLVAALKALPSQGPAANAAMDRLRILVRRDEYEVREAALHAMWMVAAKPQRGEVALLLVEALTDGARSVRALAQGCLEQLVERWQ
jgi:hypothetical protein